MVREKLLSAPLTHSLILGGARSGKSSLAEALVERQGGDCLYVATANPEWSSRDGEMDERILHHQQRRGERWTTFEEPLELVDLLRNTARPDAAVLVDCLTLWVTNLMMAERDVLQESRRLVEVLQELSGPVVFVSNEVGLGIVPMDRMSRDFRDHAGRLHQMLGEAVPTVSFVAAGLPMILKAPFQV
ncbi:bifunctional adenosylcobinamide kinase/adenosylcobinamide-phosphate guanylyltransferase [Kiloniella sp. b19]|uniref:bifunctional adenosylcobinamide kinase/adenosylcobinamide-phosphate guanylyltransferase n=1 Tax=Kiloniella sp. GXU_MW_B19 TaxID=3141326 RepID=UPI0031DA182F